MSLDPQSIRALLETLPVGVGIADRAGNIIQSNPEAQRIWASARHVDIPQYGEFKGWWPLGERSYFRGHGEKCGRTSDWRS